MSGWIERISGIIPHTGKDVDIALDGRNLIITGANGSGKTSLLREIYRMTDLIVVQRRDITLQGYKSNLTLFKNEIVRLQKNTLEYTKAEEQITRLEEQISAVTEGMRIDIPEIFSLSSLYTGRKAVVKYFEDRHFSEITPSTTARGLAEEEKAANAQAFSSRFGNNLEQHLVNLANRRQWARAKDDDAGKVKEIDDWFDRFGVQLKTLFEDDSVRLEIDSDTLKYKIIQDSKPPFDFQHLSAGYRAIFDIYAELIMRTEYFKVVPSELTGIVCIDEIDSHLHVSLQRLILPFFAESFPKIQFIVTTHSPFVLMSTPDAVVFDLAQNESITENLSYYTYSAVMEGLWKVKPISIQLEKDIRELASILQSSQKDIARLRALENKIGRYEDFLDSESKAFFLLGKEALLEADEHV
jgi:predicted ATP-binding protein involved in virulence